MKKMNMKKLMISAVMGLGLTGLVLAQAIPPAPPQGGGPGQNDGPPGDNQPGGPGGGFGPGGGGPAGVPGGGMGRGPGGPGQGPRNNPIDAMRNYVDLIEKYTALAKDPTAAGVSAVVSVTELSRPLGPVATADRLVKLLDLTKDEAVKRAIRLQLIDLYKVAKQDEKAIEQAELLIKQ